MASDIPPSPEMIFETACQAIAQGNPAKAAELLEKLTQEESGKADYISKLGTAYAIMGRRQEAIEKFRQAIAVNDNFVPAYANLALALAEEGYYQEALPLAEKGLSIDAHNLPLYSTHALILKFLDRVDDAIATLRQAQELENDNIQILANLGGLLTENGQVEEARQVLQHIIQVEPLYAPAHRMLSLSKKYIADDPHIKTMEEILSSGRLPPEAQMEIEFALGKSYEDIKDYQLSFAHYKKANDILRSFYQYNIADDKDYFEEIKSKDTEQSVNKRQAPVSDIQPIFIVGMPRSGTSLVEQILASHPQVYGAGELNTISLLYHNESDDVQALQQKYLDVVKPRLGNKKILTDKMPQNFRYIGFIKTIFPNAKIIHCKRYAIDTALSIYKIKFSGHLPFAQTQEEIAAYYKLYEDIMAHWHKILPDSIYDLSYADLVSTPEKSIRNMLEYCDLPWDEACLSPHKQKRSVTTASMLQVKQPIYTGAIDYWKNYAPYLDDLLKKLR